MTANLDAMLRAANDAIAANKKADARALLEKVLEIEEHNEQAWMNLTQVVDTTEERRICLENVLVINPKNTAAQEALRQLSTGGLVSTPSVPSPAPAAVSTPAFSMGDDDLFADMTFDNAADTDWMSEADPWTTPTSSASASSTAFEASIPDDWATSIVKKPASQTTFDDPAPGTFDSLNDDFFTGSAPASAAATPPNPFGADPFAVDDPFSDMGDFGSNPFDETPFNEDDFDSYGGSSTAAATGVVDDFDAAITQTDDEDFSALFEEGEVVQPSRTASIPDDPRDPLALFAMIPKEIAPGRMPGIDMSVPTGTRVLFVLALLLNVGALIFLLVRLATTIA